MLENIEIKTARNNPSRHGHDERGTLADVQPAGMRERFVRLKTAGKVRVGVLLWALGIPIPIILLVVLLRGCV